MFGARYKRATIFFQLWFWALISNKNIIHNFEKIYVRTTHEVFCISLTKFFPLCCLKYPFTYTPTHTHPFSKPQLFPLALLEKDILHLLYTENLL